MQKKHDKVKIKTATRASKYAVAPTKDRWASDVIVDLLHAYDLPHAALNPGATYRGLHDSIVNYGQNRADDDAVPARGDGGAGRPRLRQGDAASRWSRSCTTSWACCTPTWRSTTPTSTARRSSSSAPPGPMDETKRRPRIDWIHTAQGQGEAVRQYTKWDYQPHTIDGVPESFARAYGVMMTQPQGPVYMIYDAWLQEQKLEHEVPLPPPDAVKVPVAHRPGSRGAREGGRHDRRRRAPGDHHRVHGPRPRGLPRAGGARRDGRHPGVRHQRAPVLPEPPSAQREPLEGRVSATPTAWSASTRATGRSPRPSS